jgi:glutathione S-transferase
MKLCDCLFAPSPRRVRVFLAANGTVLGTVWVNLGAGKHLNDAFRSVNPHRTMPVLKLDDGTKLRDSNSISLLIGRDFPGPNLTGRDAKERVVIATWSRNPDFNGLGAVAECFRNATKQ